MTSMAQERINYIFSFLTLEKFDGEYCYKRAWWHSDSVEILPPGSPSGSPSGKMCDSVSQMVCLVIKNIGDITAEEIRDLFSLPGETSRVEVSDIENENQATISVPESLVPEVVKLSGVTFKGRDLVIEIDNVATPTVTGTPEGDNMATPTVTGTPEGDNMATSTVTGTPEGDVTETAGGSAGEEEGEILFMVLDVRNHPDLNFPLVNETEVCDALLQKHANDPHLAVKAGWGSRLGTFVVESTEMGTYVGSSLDIRGHEIPLKPVRRKETPDQQQTMLILAETILIRMLSRSASSTRTKSATAPFQAKISTRCSSTWVVML